MEGRFHLPGHMCSTTWDESGIWAMVVEVTSELGEVDTVNTYLVNAPELNKKPLPVV